MSQPRGTWLTPRAHERLTRELAVLEGREESGESEFTLPPTEDAWQSRITRIQEILSEAVVGETPPDDGIVEPGMTVTVLYEGDEEPETFLLGLREGTAEEELPVYSPESPIGQALIGAKPGDQRSYAAPNGRTIRLTLVDAHPYGVQLS